MPSKALESLKEGLLEIGDLERGNPSKFGKQPVDPQLTRAIGRASIVLLVSHFERYLHAVNEEVAGHINALGVTGDRIPKDLRLLHTRPAIDALGPMQWDNRANKLQELVYTDGWLWSELAIVGKLQHDRLMSWMKSPKPESVMRFYRYWQIPDIFKAITKRDHTKNDLRLRLQELTNKRNNIAHGDFTTEATQQDLRFYKIAVMDFCERADRKLAQQVKRLLNIPAPW
jgi:hypothetical protein